MSEEIPNTTEESNGASSAAEVPASRPPEAEATPSKADTSNAQSADRKIRTRPRVKISLRKGQEFQGKVKTITDFGAFIDIDLPQDGLVHISELSRHRVEKVTDVVSVGDEVTVWVKNLDKERNRISLTMRKPVELRYSDVQADDVYDGVITRIENYGVFVDIGLEREGLVHVSELSHEFVKSPQEVISVDDTVKVKVIKVNKKKKQVNLSVKALLEPPESEVAAYEEAEIESSEQDSEPMSTTMAAAFDLFNSAEDDDDEDKQGASTSKSKTGLDDVIARTLSTQSASE